MTNHTEEIRRKTIYDVAKEAGVSISTVSRVLNGNGYASPEARERVLKASADYHPNASAREIQSKRSKTIGIAIAHTPDYFFLNSVYIEVLIAVCAVVQEKGYRLLLDISENEEEIRKLYFERRIDGVILMGVRKSSSLIPQMQRDHIPFVLVGNYHGECSQICKVDINDKKAVFDAVTHLIGLGHRNIGIITGGLEFASSYDRLEGYKEALRAAGIEVRPENIEVCDNITEVKAQNLAKKLLYLPEPITALMAFNDTVAVAAYNAAKELGVSIPDQFSVIGFDDSQLARYVSPPLTSVWQPSREKGEKAASLLIDALENGTVPTEEVNLDCVMMYRGSCAPLKKN